jgi:hypothetical protein
MKTKPTDLEVFNELYARLGVTPTRRPVEASEPGQIALEICVNNDTPIKGYYGFFTVLLFDKNGKFIQQNIWE